MDRPAPLFFEDEDISSDSLFPDDVTASKTQIASLPELGCMNYNGESIPVTKADFELVSDLGHGAFGFVQLLRHRALGIELAVKKVTDDFGSKAQHDAAHTEFLADLSILRECQCPFIVTYHGYSLFDGYIWIYMEHMVGSLDRVAYLLIQQHGRFPEEALGLIATSLIQGLIYLKRALHALHRDVKPSNILFGFDGKVKLCDFGISKKMGEKSLLTSHVGTWRYIAPERFGVHADSYGVRSEVWSVGLSLYELACLRYPYGESLHEFEGMVHIVTDLAPTLPDNTGYSGDLLSFVHSCLKKNVLERPFYDKVDGNIQPLVAHTFYMNHVGSTFDFISWYRTISPDLSCPVIPDVLTGGAAGHH